MQRNCKIKSKNNPYGLSKLDLVSLAVKNGMKKNKANLLNKDELCEYLGIPNEITKKSPAKEIVKLPSKASPIKKVRKSSPIKEVRKASPIKEVKKASPVKKVRKASPVKKLNRVSIINENKLSPIKGIRKLSPIKKIKKVSSIKEKNVSPIKETSKFSKMLCVNKSKANPNGIKKNELIKLSIENGMKQSEVKRAKKETLCKFLGIPLEKNIGVKNLKDYNCMNKSSQNINGLSKSEVMDLAISKGLVGRSVASYTKKSDLCKLLGIKLNEKKYAERQFNIKNAKVLENLEFDISDLICSKLKNEFVSNNSCNTFTEFFANSLLKTSANRIFSDPSQGIVELISNSIDSYNSLEGNKSSKIGKFGMGFISLLYWVYKNDSNYIQIISKTLDEFWTAKIKCENGICKVNISILEYEKGETGTKIKIVHNKNSIELNNSLNNYLYNFSYVENCNIVLNQTGTIYSQINVYDDENTNIILVSIKENHFSVLDNATGISFEVLYKSLLVPTSSTKMIQPVSSFDPIEMMKNDKCKFVKLEKNQVSIFIVSINNIGIFNKIYYKNFGYDIILDMPPIIRVPISRDDIIISTPEEKELLRLKIRKLISISLENTNSVKQLFEVLEYWVENTNQITIKRIIKKEIYNFYNDPNILLIPYDNQVFEVLNKRIITSNNYSVLKLEKAINNAFESEKGIIPNKNVIFTNLLKENFSNCGTINYIFINEDYKNKFKNWKQIILNSYDSDKLNLPDGIKDSEKLYNVILSRKTFYSEFSNFDIQTKDFLVTFSDYLYKIFTNPNSNESYYKTLYNIISETKPKSSKASNKNILIFNSVTIKSFPISPNFSIDHISKMMDFIPKKINKRFYETFLEFFKYESGINRFSMFLNINPGFLLYLIKNYNKNEDDELLLFNYCISKKYTFLETIVSISCNIDIIKKYYEGEITLITMDNFIYFIRTKLTESAFTDMVRENGNKYDIVLKGMYKIIYNSVVKNYSNKIFIENNFVNNGNFEIYNKVRLSYLINYMANYGFPKNFKVDSFKQGNRTVKKELQVIDIAINFGTSKEIIPSILTELIQNSKDAIVKQKNKKMEINIKIISEGNNTRIIVEDPVGIEESNILVLLIPFISSKAIKQTEEPMVGINGTGFFNLYRQPICKEVYINTKCIDTGKSYGIKATPLVEKNYVNDVLYEFYRSNILEGTRIEVLCNGRYENECNLIINSFLKGVNVPINLNGEVLKYDKMLLSYLKYNGVPMCNIYYSENSNTESMICSNGMPMAYLSEYYKLEPAQNSGIIIDFKPGVITQNQSRNKVIISDGYENFFKHCVYLSVVYTLCYRIIVKRDNSQRSYVPGLNYTGDFYNSLFIYNNYVFCERIFETGDNNRVDFNSFLMKIYNDCNKLKTNNLKATILDYIIKMNIEINFKNVLYIWFKNKDISDDKEVVKFVEIMPKKEQYKLEIIQKIFTEFVNLFWEIGKELVENGKLGNNFHFNDENPLFEFEITKETLKGYYDTKINTIILDPIKMIQESGPKFDTFDKINDYILNNLKNNDFGAKMIEIPFFEKKLDLPTLIHELCHAWRKDKNYNFHGPRKLKIDFSEKEYSFYDEGYTVYNLIYQEDFYTRLSKRLLKFIK